MIERHTSSFLEAMRCRGYTALWSHFARAALIGSSPALIFPQYVRAARRDYRACRKGACIFSYSPQPAQPLHTQQTQPPHCITRFPHLQLHCIVEGRRTSRAGGRHSPGHRVAAVAGQWSLYDDPPLYERVFADRDYEQDVCSY